jgi:hypothetical protein
MKGEFPMDRTGLSKEELLDRWLDKREVRNIMGKISSLYAIRQEATIFEKFWSERDDVCLGLNDGYFNGREAVAGYYDGLGKRVEIESQIVKKAFAKQLGDKTDEELHGVGSMIYKPYDTQVVEIAKDGQTAKGLWCMRGSHTAITTAGPVAYWQFGWVAVDFIREGEEFKIWHMLDLTDIDSPCGDNWGEPEKERPAAPDFAAVTEIKDPQPNVPCVLHKLYTSDREFMTSPAIPKPYTTFAETFSYGL